jgi:hypothetical protein
MLTNIVNSVYDLAMDLPSGLLEALREATGRSDVHLAEWSSSPADHRVENMTTASLTRYRGVLDDGTPWRLFAKELHPASCSPAWCEIPEEFRARVLIDLDWLDEPRVFEGGLSGDLPAGFRMPALWHVGRATERLTLWLEHVDDTTPWDLARYRRTAASLGALHARWPEERAGVEADLRRRDLTPLLVGKVAHHDLPIQADDAFWALPEIASAVDERHRPDLARLAREAPLLVEHASRLAHGAAHGDATPANFLEPGDGTIVAIDWSYGSLAPPGADLGQLLIGRFESGDEDPALAPEIAETIVDGYLDGSAAEGHRLERQDVELGFATHLAVRSVFSALVVDHRPDLDDAGRAELTARRARTGRFGLDLAFRVLDRLAVAPG